MILPQKTEIQPGIYMLGSKFGWIVSGRTNETFENTTESRMLTFLICVDKSLPMKPNLEIFGNLELYELVTLQISVIMM